MYQYFVTSENTEDRFGSAESLDEAMRIAREAVKDANENDPICIEYQGKNIMQIIRMPDGNIVMHDLG